MPDDTIELILKRRFKKDVRIKSLKIKNKLMRDFLLLIEVKNSVKYRVIYNHDT